MKELKRVIAYTVFAVSKMLDKKIDIVTTAKHIHGRWLANNNRSRPQLSLYWAAWLPAIIENWPEHLGAEPKPEDLHYRLKFWFCYNHRPDLFIEKYALVSGNKKEKVFLPFSAGLGKIKKRDFNEYMDFVIKWTTENIGFDLKLLS